MTPPTVNAYYNEEVNEIVFPAGILQVPFFDPQADDAVTYGGIGTVIGHEMSHGFDDQGRQYDAFTPLSSVHINGKLTMGENLADLGGLTIAYQALQKTQQAKEGKAIDGFMPNQRFFLSNAQIFRSSYRPAALRQLLLTNPHSPAQYRVLGTLMNMPEFYQAFGYKDGSKMMRAADRSRIW